MIDIALLRKEYDKIAPLLKKKEPSLDLDALLNLDQKLRESRSKVEDLRSEKNKLSAGGAAQAQETREQSIALGRDLKELEGVLKDLESAFQDAILRIPNILQDDVPEGGKDRNVAVRSYGEKPVFSFKPKHHLELNEKLNWFDFEAAAAMSSSQFPFYKGDAVKMLYALTRMMLKNNAAHGFEPVMPPYLVNRAALINSSNLPKFEGDFYEIEKDNLCLIPTAEVPLTNIYASKIFNINELPIRHTAWTPCFRREAGTYGSGERGLIRIHQFEKVELYSICGPDKSDDELGLMQKCAETLLQQLGLHYRVSLLAAQDCSFASSKTYDIEVWLPGQDQYYEVSSASNCTDFQARRAKIRYRDEEGQKPQLAHTLNASSLALPRLMVALIESSQQEDGTLKLPQVLVDEMNALW